MDSSVSPPRPLEGVGSGVGGAHLETDELGD